MDELNHWNMLLSKRIDRLLNFIFLGAPEALYQTEIKLVYEAHQYIKLHKGELSETEERQLHGGQTLKKIMLEAEYERITTEHENKMTEMLEAAKKNMPAYLTEEQREEIIASLRNTMNDFEISII